MSLDKRLESFQLDTPTSGPLAPNCWSLWCSCSQVNAFVDFLASPEGATECSLIVLVDNLTLTLPVPNNTVLAPLEDLTNRLDPTLTLVAVNGTALTLILVVPHVTALAPLVGLLLKSVEEVDALCFLID